MFCSIVTRRIFVVEMCSRSVAATFIRDEVPASSEEDADAEEDDDDAVEEDLEASWY